MQESMKKGLLTGGQHKKQAKVWATYRECPKLGRYKNLTDSVATDDRKYDIKNNSYKNSKTFFRETKQIIKKYENVLNKENVVVLLIAYMAVNFLFNRVHPKQVTKATKTQDVNRVWIIRSWNVNNERKRKHNQEGST